MWKIINYIFITHFQPYFGTFFLFQRHLLSQKLITRPFLRTDWWKVTKKCMLSMFHVMYTRTAKRNTNWMNRKSFTLDIKSRFVIWFLYISRIILLQCDFRFTISIQSSMKFHCHFHAFDTQRHKILRRK